MSFESTISAEMKYKVVTSVLIGIGFVALVWITMDLTWIFGITLLMPGITVLRLLPYFRILDSTPIPVLLTNAAIYSMIAFAILQTTSRFRRDINFRKLAALVAVVSPAFLLFVWGLTRAAMSALPPD
jgi:hypothetical protein